MGDVRILITDRGRARDHVFFFSPRTQVDLLAALAAEGAEFIDLSPFDLVTAGRTIDDRHHDEESEIAECQIEGHIAFVGLGLVVAALSGEAYPQYIFIGRDFRYRCQLRIQADAQQLIGASLQHLLETAGSRHDM